MKRWVLRSFLLLLVAGFLFRAALLQGAASFLIEEDAPVSADAIVVLAGSVPDRTLEAVALYREGYAQRIVLSRAPESPVFRQLEEMAVHFPSPSQLARSIAEQLGVPPSDIVEVGGSSPSTFAEAEDLLRYAGEQGYRTILLVTSKTHTRRATLIFRHLAAGRVRIVARPSRYDPFDPGSWWRERIAQRNVVFEYEKLAVFYLIDRWRLHGTNVWASGSANG
jgi:uncharacterized SAM-binding protein YcdF (DUF218 family)